MKLIQKFATRNECYQVGRKVKVKGLMLHSVGIPQASAKSFADSWNTYLPNGEEVCVHAFLQADGEVYQLLPWDYESWHCGGSANKTHIGIEMCEPETIRYVAGATWEDQNPAETEAYVLGTYKTAVDLFAELCKRYQLDPQEEGVILSHSEGYRLGIASGHADVEHIWKKFGLTMDKFRKDVSVKMSQGEVNMTKDELVALVDSRIQAYFANLDSRPASRYAEEHIAYCKENGLMVGDSPAEGETEGAFRPMAFLKRQELTVVLHKVVEKLRQEFSK